MKSRRYPWRRRLGEENTGEQTIVSGLVIYSFIGAISIVILACILAGFYFISQDIDGVFVGWVAGVAVSIFLTEVLLQVAAGVV